MPPLSSPKICSTPRPGSAEYRAAIACLARRSIHAAIGLFDSARRAGHDPIECAAKLWTCHMFVGDFERAWRESDFIAAAGAPDSSRLRDGNPWLGRRIILRCLHGYGDAIQFIRYAPMLRRDAASLIIETHPEMVSTLRRAEGVDEIVSWGSAAPPIPPRWDAQIEIMELPRAFRTTAATIPRRLPYLTADPERAERARLMFDGTRLPKIGIVWASSGYNPARNIPLRQLTPILADRRFAWFSLQHGAERDDLRMVNAAAHVRDMAPLSPEIADTAAIMANLDLIITVDGVAAHLAGALARPVWTLLPYQADWRWMVDRNDSPWYPTMRLFRQSAPGNWRRAIGELVELLERFRHRFEFPSLSNGN